MFSSSHERAIRICLTAIAASSLLALAGIVIFLFTEGLPLFRHVSPLDFLLGDLWYPTEDPGLFGIFRCWWVPWPSPCSPRCWPCLWAS